MSVKPVPEEHQNAVPYLIVPNVGKLIDFIKDSFNGEEIERFANPDGRIMHASVRIGDSMIMMGDPGSQYDPMPGSVYLYVNDTDEAYRRAMKAGATSIMEPSDQFYGDRNAGVKDSHGNMWWIATRIEDVSKEELEKRAQEQHAKQCE